MKQSFYKISVLIILLTIVILIIFNTMREEAQVVSRQPIVLGLKEKVQSNSSLETIERLESTISDLNRRLRDLEAEKKNKDANNISNSKKTSQFSDENLESYIDDRIEKNVENQNREFERLQKTSSKNNSQVQSLEEAAERLNIDRTTLFEINELLEKRDVDLIKLVKDNNETVEEFRERIQDIKDDPGKKEAFLHSFMPRLIKNNGMSKLSEVDRKYKSEIKALIGDKKAKSFENITQTLRQNSLFEGGG